LVEHEANKRKEFQRKVPDVAPYDYRRAVIYEKDGYPPKAEGEFEQPAKRQFMKDLGLNDKDRHKLRIFEELDANVWFVEVKHLNTGQSFGELALNNNAPRAATITSVTDCYFACVSRADYQRVFKKMEWKEV
jgi:CRP-like cAMP-binding protein